LDENDADEKKLLNSRALNVQAYSALCISCEGSAFGIVERAATPRLPNGDTALAWKSLCEKYEPTTQMSLVILKKQFAQCNMGKETEPDAWFTELSYYRARINSVQKASKKGHELTDDNVIAHVLANLPMDESIRRLGLEYGQKHVGQLNCIE
jgi:gag-polypeptide of LTR copia-type